MSIGYVRIPHFAIAVARRDDPTLAGHPLLLVEEDAGLPAPACATADRCHAPAGHATVYAGSEQALACGVQPGMSLAHAQRLCPEARLAPATESTYLATFETCLDTLGLFAPKVEAEGLGNAYLDFDGLVRDPKDAIDLYQQLSRQLAHDQHLIPSMGATMTMFGAAALGVYVRSGYAVALPSGVEREFLALFPTRVLPVNDEMIRRLQLLGLREIGQYADLPAGVILNQFGWEGQRACLRAPHRQAHRLARGEDDRRVQPGRPRLIETAGHQFEDPIADAAVLAAVCNCLVSQLVNRIRDRYLAPQAMYLQLGLEDGPSREAQVIFPAPTADEGELQRVADRLTRSISINSGVLSGVPSSSKGRVTEVQVGLGKLQPLVGRQLTLFPTQADQDRQLRQLITNLTRRYGRDGFRQPQVVDACLCGARRQAGALVLERRFILNRWDPFDVAQDKHE